MNAFRILRRATIAAAMILVLMAQSMPSVWGRHAPDRTVSHRAETQLAGTWIGDSICQVKNSPCHDERAIYRVSKPDEAGGVTIDMGKIVDGQPESMGVLVFNYDRESGTLISDQKHGVWKLKVNGDKMEGTLTLHDGTIYRRMSLRKT